MLSFLKKTVVLIFLFCNTPSFASGGYDNGTPAGKGNLSIELTINPFRYFKFGQSYIVWGYGLTKRIDFHGYVSRPASGVNQLYTGFMYNFISNKYVDLSTAIGLRFQKETIHPFLPQLLYTIKLPKKFEIIGSFVIVGYTSEKFKDINSYETALNKYKAGITYDIAIRATLPIKKLPTFIKDIKIAVGAFRGVSHHIYPTYSIDFRFDLFKSG